MHQLDWKVLNSEYLLQNEWIAVRADTCEMGNGRLIDPYYIMESGDYVNIVPVTAAGEIVMARIYRHGVGRTLLETPGGLIDDGEAPLDAARRELLEETGCDCAALQLIGSGSPDPARMSCKAYYFLATGVVETAVPNWDHTEEMELLKLPIAQVKKMLFAGEIVDSVQQSALFFALHALGGIVIVSSRYPGRVMALDLGSVRIGVALSDPTRTIAQSYGVVKRKSREEDFARYQQILAEQKVTLLLVGLPTTSEGGDSDTAVWIRDYMAEFSQQCPVPIQFWDESYTTVQAEDSLRQRGKRGKKARQQVDAVAAAFILQSYLDAQRNVIE